MIESDIDILKAEIYDLARILGYVEWSNDDGWLKQKEVDERSERMMKNLDRLAKLNPTP